MVVVFKISYQNFNESSRENQYLLTKMVVRIQKYRKLLKKVQNITEKKLGVMKNGVMKVQNITEKKV